MIRRRYISFHIICIALVFLTSCAGVNIQKEQSSNSVDSESFLHAKVKRVVDGDTITVEFKGGKKETIRLLLVDTPETVHPEKPVQPFGLEASKFMKELLPPDTEIQVELGISERDKYGRILAYVYVQGEMVNSLLLEKGLARVAYIYPPNTKYIEQFQAVQDQARKKEIGIWSIENYVTKDNTFNENIKILTDTRDENCTIKGNINSDGEHIYHTTSSKWYEQTKAEVWFCTEEEARDAGFRAPLQ